MQKRNVILLLLVQAILVLACKKSKTNNNAGNQNPPPATLDWKFDSSTVWSDEFATDGKADAAKWSYDVGGDGWGNNELEYYTNGMNDSVKNGILYIIATKENY